MPTRNPYAEALQFIRQNPTTGGAASMAKLVLSLYNEVCGYSFAECVGNLDEQRKAIALHLVTHYAEYGETPELRNVGEVLVNELYPKLWEMGQAISYAREAKREEWQRQHDEWEAAKIYAAERQLQAQQWQQIPFETVLELIGEPEDGKFYSEFFTGSWKETRLPVDLLRDAVNAFGATFAQVSPNMSNGLAVLVDGQMHYISVDYDARERYLASMQA